MKENKIISCNILNYSLCSFEIRCDVTSGRLRTSLRVTIKHVCFVAIPYTTRAFHGTSPEIRNLPEVTGSDITSNLKAVQTVFIFWYISCINCPFLAVFFYFLNNPFQSDTLHKVTSRKIYTAVEVFYHVYCVLCLEQAFSNGGPRRP